MVDAGWWGLAAGAVAVAAAWPVAQRRLELSLGKHPSLTGHSRWAKRVAGWLPGYDYDTDRFFTSDGAPADVAERRREALERLGAWFQTRCARSIAATREARSGLSDLQFTSRYRVPFPYSDLLRENLTLPAFVESAEGVDVIDLDGNRLHDLSGSYGVNLFGFEFYRECLDEAHARARPLGPVLGQYHPCVVENIERLKAISGLDEVSFHMSGTEAVMQAVRLARYHTRRSHVVRFCGSYHGWWDDVQPGPGNPSRPRDVYTLRDLDDRALRVLRRRRDIACVLVNPLQALHPNRAAPGDSSLVDSSRTAGFDRAGYTAWLKQLREVCTERGIVLIMDEVFLGFRLAPGGAQHYFDVKADLVTYGKTLGGGLPVGVVCGRADLMRRFRTDHPADICFARGTFNAHPQVMAAMKAFLDRLQTPRIQSVYEGLDELWNQRRDRFNQAMRDAGLPVEARNLSSVWTLTYREPSRYNWMLQFYLRRHGLLLSWVGTGRLIWSLNHTDADFESAVEKFVAAGRDMQADGWWWPGSPSNKTIRRTLLKETIQARFS
jgi:glutamate-1-semialdehyde 2,1-aminomutase